MFSRFFTKTVTSFILVSLLIPSALLFHPQQTQAQAKIMTCAARAASALGILGASAAAHLVVVPVGDVPNKAAFTTTATSDFGQFFAECVLKPVAIRLAAAMLHNMTNSIVNWINNGFEGNPTFVTDLDGLMKDSVDEAIGQFLSEDLGAGFLCSPFAFQVRIAVAQTYLPYRQRAACTLSQIQQNVNGFIEGNNTGGWENWLEVTTVPQNNVYGATILAQNELSRIITEKLNIEGRELDWGRGFRSIKQCEPDPFSYIEGADSQPEICTTVTPGAAIEGQLVNALGSDMRKLELADDLDAIIGALMNQITFQVLDGAKGLLGAGRKQDGSYSSTNYNDAINPSNFDPAFTNAANNGIEQFSIDADLDRLFDESTYDLSTTSIEIATSTPDATNEPFVPRFVVASSTIILSDTAPLFYDSRVFANKASTTIRVSTFITNPRASIQSVPYNQIAFSDLFSDLTLTVGQVRGVINSRKPAVGDKLAAWDNAEIKDTGGYMLRYAGTKKPGAQAGVYNIEIVISANGTVLGKWSDQIIVQ